MRYHCESLFERVLAILAEIFVSRHWNPPPRRVAEGILPRFQRRMYSSPNIFTRLRYLVVNRWMRLCPLAATLFDFQAFRWSEFVPRFVAYQPGPGIQGRGSKVEPEVGLG